MELALLIIFLWIFSLVENVANDQSLSFSPPINRSISPSNSFWHGTIPLPLLDQNITIQVYLSEFNGLLFYGIDNQYRSLWIHFDNMNFLISYHNFKTDSSDPEKLEITKLCNLQQILQTSINLKLSLSGKTLMINCNRNEKNLYYAPYPESVNNESLTKFIVEMKLPIPNFQSINGSQTYIWMGNTPSASGDTFQNVVLESQPSNLFGCLQSLELGSEVVNLTSTGVLSGNMVEPFCRPVCDNSPCYKNTRCTELWRGRFRCQCGLTGFIGQFCNESQSVYFDGHRSIDINIENQLKKLQVVFKQRTSNYDYESKKVFSIQFVFDQSLYVYIGPTKNLMIKFVTEKQENIQLSFTIQILYNIPYMLIIETDTNGINFKLVNTVDQNVVEEKRISQVLSSLVTTKIVVGDSHAESMAWMKNFTGCISNLILTKGKRKFFWNSIMNFTQLPKCDDKTSTEFSNPLRKPLQDVFGQDTATRLNTLQSVEIKTGSVGPIVIGIIVTIVVLAVVAAFLLYKYRSKINPKNKKDKIIIQHNKDVTPKDNLPVSVQYLPSAFPSPQTYKKPYVASTISKDSNYGQSEMLLRQEKDTEF